MHTEKTGDLAGYFHTGASPNTFKGEMVWGSDVDKVSANNILAYVYLKIHQVI